MFSSKIRMLVAATTIFLGAGTSQATPTIGLYLAMDGSGSIIASDFTTQVNAYSSALNGFFSANPSAYGEVAIGGGIFGANFSQFFPVTDIANAGVLSSLTTAILGLDPGRGGINTGATAIGDAITASANALTVYESGLGTNLKLIIDVTTDGANNQGTNPTTVAGALTPSPIDAINCLGIGLSANCSFVTVSGAGTNYGSVSFAGLERALADKLYTETIPEPATLALLGIGLAGLGFSRRRKQKLIAA